MTGTSLTTFIANRYRQFSQSPALPYAAALLTIVMMMTFTWIMEDLERLKFYHQTRTAALHQLSTIKVRLESELTRQISLTKGLEAYISVLNPHLKPTEFENLARIIIDQQPSIQSLVLYQNSIVTHIYPLAGNESAIGFNPLTIPIERQAIEIAIKTKKPIVTGPFNLVEGGLSFITRTPVFLTAPDHNGDYWGLVGLIIDQNLLFKNAGLIDSQAYFEFALRDPSKIFFGNPELFKQDPITLPITLPTSFWQLAAVPKTGWPTHPPSSHWWWLAGSLFALLLGKLVFLLVQTPLRLQATVAQATHALKQAETQLTQFLETMPVGVIILDAHGNLFYRNHKAIQIFGSDFHNFSSLYLAGTQQPYPHEKLPMLQALHGEIADCENLEIHRDNKIISLEIWGTPIWDEHGNVQFSLSAVQDISARKRAQTRLRNLEKQQRESLEAQLCNLAANVPGIIYQWYERQDGQRGYYYVSPRCQDFYGISAEQLQQNYSLLRIHPEDLPRWQQSIQQAVACKSDWSFEGRFILPSGKIKWWRGVAKPIIVSPTEMVFNGLIIDISQQKNLEEALRTSEQRLLEAIEAISDGFAYYDAEDKLVLCNQKYLDLNRCDRLMPRTPFAEILRHSASQYPQAKGRVNEWMAERFRACHTGQIMLQPLEGGRWLRLAEHHTKDGGHVSLYVDITDLKCIEEQLANQNLELQLKNQQLEEFAKQLAELEKQKFSYELLQLNRAYERFVPSEFLKLLDKKSILDVKLGDQVKKEMTVLFCDLRGFTGISEKMSPEEIFNFVNTYFGQMEPVILEHQGVIDKYIGDAIMVLFPTNADDAVQAAVTMLTLLHQYNRVLVRLGYQALQIGIGLHTGPLMLGIVGGHNRMEGTVIADAVNLASRVEGLTKIYGTPLLMTEQTYLKLASPSRYHIRVIDVVKVKGKSETVTVYEVYDADLPDLLTAKDQTRGQFEEGFFLYHAEEYEAALPFFEKVLTLNPHDKATRIYLKRCQEILQMNFPHPSTLLIVDDIADNLQLLLEFFTQQNFEVLIAKTGQEALEIVKHQRPHLILLDVMMPEMDGFTICSHLKENPETKDIPIIFMTALADSVDKVKGFQMGAVDYVTKPLEMQEVLMRVNTHIKINHLQQQLHIKNLQLEERNLALHKKLSGLKKPMSREN